MYIHVKVSAGAKKEVFEEEKPGYFNVVVKEKAERNMANERVRELVALHFGLPVGKVRIISGHHHGKKILSVDTDSLL